MSQATDRYGRFLRQRYCVIAAHTGLITVIIGLLILAPAIMLLVYPDERPALGGFLGPGLVLVTGGLLAWRQWLPHQRTTLTYQEGTAIVVLSWLLAVTAGAAPFMIVDGLSFTQAVFESTSGWTTTGLSVVDVTTAPHVVLFYRSLCQLAGGAGLAIITLSAITGPFAGPGVSVAEGRGEQLAPHVARSAKLVLGIYMGYIAVGIPALRLAGMGWFDAVNHAFAALSTGGFSTRVESIGYWDSPWVEAVIVVLMLLGTTNFVTSYLILTGRGRVALRSGELRIEAVLLPLFVLVLLLGVTLPLYHTLGKGLRVAVFEAVSALSTSGFSTVSYLDWNGLGILALIALMLVGGGTGSTAGAIKQFRIYVLLRASWDEVVRVFRPRTAIREIDVWQGDRRQFLGERAIRQVAVFVFVYMVTIVAGAMIVAAHGYALSDSLFEISSALGTVGLSVGITGPSAPAGVLWTEIVCMFLGRLEFFTVIVGVAKLAMDGPRMWPWRND